MWAIIIALPVLGVLMAVTAFSDRTVAVTQTRTESHNAAVYYVAVPAGIKAFPVDLVPLP
jgi:hypothetical protein